jgi:hypothetical protein
LRTREKTKIPFPELPQPAPKKKNWTPHESMLSILIGLMKLFVTILTWANYIGQTVGRSVA